MKKYIYFLFSAVLLLILAAIVYKFSFGTEDDLNQLNLNHLKVFYSNNYQERAEKIGQRTNQALELFNPVFQYDPAVDLLILNSTDWSRHTRMPVYGMPHYQNGSLIVAASENDFWSGFLPAQDQLPDNQAELIRNTYLDTTGKISLKRFFDFVALHELAHAYHLQAQVNMQRKWLQELFANLVMYTYLAEQEHASIPAVMVFSEMVVNAGSDDYKYVSLEDFENHYDLIASREPQNYGWYQSKLNLMAREIYDRGGLNLLRQLWQALKNSPNHLNDQQLHQLLQNTLGQDMADKLKNW
ncbi:MAG: hypothetical protein ACNS62_22470 [Candidatus Cyclobacteriaceae bacterium M3_2C_046]